jgi:hypothetical protein
MLVKIKRTLPPLTDIIIKSHLKCKYLLKIGLSAPHSTGLNGMAIQLNSLNKKNF